MPNATTADCHKSETSYIRAYWDDIQNGRAIVGYYVRQQMKILLADLENPEMQIDFAAAEKRIRFIEKECRHSESPFAGKPFLLMPWQKAIIEAIFAIKSYNAELQRYVRKYQEVLLVVARKNGKTPMASAISLAEWYCGEMGTKILYGSNDYDQADLLYMATDAMREASPKLARCTRRNQKGIFFGSLKQRQRVGKFTSQNKGSIRKMSARTSAKEGRNIKIGVVDEIHELRDDTFVMPIKQALSTQDEPLYFELTTEGFVEDGYLDSRLKLAESVLNGEIEKPNFLIFWFAQDNEEEIWRDENSWYKSNPGLGVIKKWSFLRGMVEDAKLSAATRAFVLAKDFNVKQNNAAAWLPESVVVNTAEFDMEMLRGQFYIGGIDLSETTDLTAATALFINPWTKQKYALSKYFVPEIKLDEKIDTQNNLNPERKDYREWARQGFATICPGNEVDSDYVVAWYAGLAETFGVRPFKFGFDVWHSAALKKSLASMFGEDTLTRVAMNFFVLSNPMSLLESDLTIKALNYGNNPVTRWCLKNTALKINNVGLKMPVKIHQSKNRIDGAVALIIAYAAAATCKTEYDYLQKNICAKAEGSGEICL